MRELKHPGLSLNDCLDREALTAGLAHRLRDAIETAVAGRGHALIAVSGGSTPVPAYRLLNRVQLPWKRVTLVPTDERWVGIDDPQSNEGMLRREMPNAVAAGLSIIPLADAGSYDDPRSNGALIAIQGRLRSLDLPFDLVVLGMGVDGHTASLFPDDEGLESALVSSDPAAPAAPPSQPTPRVTLTPAWLRQSRAILLAMAGDDKWQTLHHAMEGADFPISRFFGTHEQPLEIWYSP